MVEGGRELQIQSLTHEIIELHRKSLDYGVFRRRLEGPKIAARLTGRVDMT